MNGNTFSRSCNFEISLKPGYETAVVAFKFIHAHACLNIPPSPLSQSSQPDPLELQRQQESRRRAVARRRAREQLRPRSPEAVEGRRHVDVQTELYLEEITDRVEEADVTTQTDAFLDRPPTPLFVPAKTGVDVATQIEEGEVSVYLHLSASLFQYFWHIRIP